MNKYGQASIKAVKLITAQNCLAPEEAWKIATIEVFGIGTTSQMKGCPKNTFLALCETGKVKGIKAGSYTKSTKNKGYAIKALELLSEEPSYSENPNLLWNKVINDIPKKHNSQMNVVLALWNEGLIGV